jgi:tetratricopeptide (TPR) repeat protein
LDRWLVAAVVATALIVLSLPLYLVRRGSGDPTAGGEALADFVGRDQCVACHQSEVDAWSGSHHDMAMAVASDSTVRGDFSETSFVLNGDSTRFFRRDGGFFIETVSRTGERAEHQVTHTFGWEPLQQYLIPFPGGRLQAFSIAWDTELGEWFFLYPGRDIPADDWLHWTRGAQNWNGMCAECHSTNLVKGYDPETRTFNTTWSEINVSCEACHGPASLHVEWAEMPEMARPPDPAYGLVIATGTQTSQEQVALCAPCHSRRSELGDYDHRSPVLMDNVVPRPLREGLYHADGQILEEVYVWGSFVQSKMYANDIQCADCHDVHSLERHAEGNALCAQCHRPDTYDSPDHHFHEVEVDGESNPGAQCVNCHMVQKPFMVRDWRADHSLRVPRPDLTREIETPNACSEAGCHGDRSLDWVLGYYEQWYGEARRPHYGQVFAWAREGRADAGPMLMEMATDPLYSPIVRATALEYLATFPSDSATEVFRSSLQDEDPLIRFTALASASAATPEQYVELVSPLLFDPVKAVRTEAASRLAGAPVEMLQAYQQEQFDGALAEYETALRHGLDFAASAHNLGNLYAARGDAFQAEYYYREALLIDDLFIPAKTNLAVILNSQGRNDEAERLLTQVLEADPEQYEVAYSMGLLLAEMGRIDEAVAFLGRAASGLPTRARIQYNHGLALQAVGRMGEAEGALTRAVDLQPESLDFLFALADHFVQRQEWTQALEIADRMIELAPSDPRGVQVRQFVESNLR